MPQLPDWSPPRCCLPASPTVFNLDFIMDKPEIGRMINSKPPHPMNEPDSGAVPFDLTTPPVPFKDRHVGLVIYGILTLLLGGLIGLFIPLMLFGLTASAKATGTPVNTAGLAPAICMYGILAVALIWLGIGSIMARRWARALLLIFSWTWLVFGVLVTAAMAFVLPTIFRSLPANTSTGQPSVPMLPMLVGMLVVFGIGFVLLPACWTFFYRSRHVKATCDTRDPVVRWTDACPLPVLGFCLWQVLAVLTFLVLPLAGHGVMPFFGTFLTGVPGTLIYFVMALVWGYAAWSLYRLEQRGWWVILLAMVLFALSSVLTYAFHDVAEMYRLMGYPEAQVQQMQAIGIFSGHRMGWLTALSMLPFLIYLLWIKRYLHRPV